MAEVPCGRIIIIGAPVDVQGYFDLSSFRFGARRDTSAAISQQNTLTVVHAACGGSHTSLGPSILRGFRNVPWGVHAVAFSLSEHAPKSCACIFMSEAQPLAVFMWNDASETLSRIEDGAWGDAASSCVRDTSGVCCGLAASSVASLMESVAAGRMDDLLAAIEFDPAWSRISAHITPATLDRILPVGGIVGPDTSRADGAVLSRTAAVSSATLSRIHFVRLIGTDADSSPEERTAFGRDTSTALTSACAEIGGLEQFIAEMQLSFLLFLLGEHLHSLQQWKLLVHTVLCAESALTDTRAALAPALDAVRHQITRLPPDFFADPLSQRNFLRASLRRFAFILRGMRSEGRRDTAVQSAGFELLRTVQQHCAVDIMNSDEWGSGSSSPVAHGAATFASMEQAMRALAADAEDDDMPAIVADGEEYAM